jgi:hypothetical protein
MRRFSSHKAEEMRLRALYRERAMRGQLKGLPLKALRTFTGPDCAYHLYGTARSLGRVRPQPS